VFGVAGADGVFEGVGVQAVDRPLSPLDLGRVGGATVFDRRPLGVLVLACGFDGLPDEVAIAVDVGELFDDGVLQLFTRDPLAVTAFGPRFCRPEQA
jgi:hypothetical protein